MKDLRISPVEDLKAKTLCSWLVIIRRDVYIAPPPVVTILWYILKLERIYAYRINNCLQAIDH
jgi:hypothetical protein